MRVRRVGRGNVRVRGVMSCLIVAGLPLVIAGCASRARGSPIPPPGVDLSGTWILDVAASTDFATAMATRPGGPIRPGGAGWGGSGPRVRGGGAGAQGGSGGRIMGGGGGRMIMDAETIYRAMESLSTVPERLTLGHEESTVTLSHPDGWTLTLPTTGKTLTASWFGGTEVDIQADWRHDALRIERTRDVVTAVDALTYDPSSSRLMIETTIAGGMAGEVKLRRIYQRRAQDTSGAAEGDPVFQEPGRDGVGRP